MNERIAYAIVAAVTTCCLSCGGQPPQPAPPVSSAPPMTPTTAPSTAEESSRAEPAPAVATGLVQPEVAPGDDGWEVYTSTVEVTPATAAETKPGTASPEAAVIHFYAGLMRGDGSHEEALIPDRSERLEKKLARVVGWTYSLVRLERRKPSGDGAMWIKIYYEVEVPLPGRAPDRDEGTDDVEVTHVGGRWYVSSVPT